MKLILKMIVATFGMIQLGVTSSKAGIVTFGSGDNEFQMEFVTIGNPGNAADTTGKPNPAGSVAYTYRIAKYETQADYIAKYNATFGNANNLAITYGNLGKKPANYVSWNEAARFVNWLNTDSGGYAAYKFTTVGVQDNIALWTTEDPLDYDPLNPFRSKRATYVLPSTDEWYKAAYYDPNKPGGAGYWKYTTGSDTAPTAVSSGTTPGTAVFNLNVDYDNNTAADADLAGGLSPYGVMGLGGNLLEWQEGAGSGINLAVGGHRAKRGGWYNDTNASGMLSTSFDNNKPPTYEIWMTGFRVVSLSSSAPPAVPEPSTLVIGTLFGLGGLLAKRRMKR
jgi:formylglycine-generating enzyme required for sulfatase activity